MNSGDLCPMVIQALKTMYTPEKNLSLKYSLTKTLTFGMQKSVRSRITTSDWLRVRFI